MKQWLSVCLAVTALALSAAENDSVEPRRRYRAEFEIRASGVCYPLDWFCIHVPVKYPHTELVFLDADGKPMRAQRAIRYYAFSDRFEPGVVEFYAPERADKVRMKTADSEVRNFRLTRVEPGNDLALPLDYRIGGQFTRAEITPGKDGSGIFDVSSGNVHFYPVPVEPGAIYRLTVHGGKGDKKQTGLVIRFSFSSNGSTKEGKVSSDREPMRIGGKKTSFTTTFKVPEEARWFHLFAMWGIVYDYQLEKIQ